MKVILLQTVDLYGTRYGVGLRDIPAGHACGVAWDGFVNAGWVKFLDAPAEKLAAVVEEVAEVIEEVIDDSMPEIDGIVSDVADDIPVKKTRKKKSGD